MPTFNDVNHEFAALCEDVLVEYYGDAIQRLIQHYPQEQRSLTIDYGDLLRKDPDMADDALDQPELVREHFEYALERVDVPVDVDLSRAHVRLDGLPVAHTYYPGHFSPSEHNGKLRAVEGEIVKATDVYSRIEEAAFECQRCGTLAWIPMDDGHYQEPHECEGCDRQGPFQINFEQSEFVDGQKLRIQTPPEEAHGDGQDIDVFVEDDLCDHATVGDRVTVAGIVRLEQQGQGQQKQNKFDPYLEGVSIEVEQTDAEDIDVTAAQRERIRELAAGDHGDPLALAAETLAPKIHGYDDVKRAIVLALVGGSRAEYGGGDFDRGEFHVLLIGDPSTAKSKLVERAEQVGWRSVGVSGTGATVAGVTATAVQDDFGDGSWTLDAGAAVKAHRGVLAIDELDDMPAEVRAALLEPMSKQTIHITKGGINTHLQTRTAVVAAANPERDRFDPYTPIAEQFAFSSTLLSRFDLVYTFCDEPDEEADAAIGGHILDARDAAKREQRGEDPDSDAHRGPIEPETLRAWVALAKQQPEPKFAGGMRDRILDQFTSLRGMYGYESGDNPVPVTFRKLEGIVRVAEAAAKFEFSETIEARHVEIASQLVGRSMEDIGKDPETGEYDADVQETGSSKAQKNRKQQVIETIKDLQSESDADQAAVGDVVDVLGEQYAASDVKHDIRALKESGEAIEPETGAVRYIGEW
ncbi:MAG: minichromosome maintenance protein MCM [Halobacteriales archaeon]